MALPKRKHSKARSKKRRTHWKTKSPTLHTCPQCNQPKMPHRACPNCGYYRGRPVVTPPSS
ncbi:MAG: 50S ribosomal protein L32 [Candidatus Marinimicrobia bacterium]|nr:50S ribosomal protein L32 [Candidatus Neomarinimicrobiota bacterium]MDP6456193.1 50S ribosomal protein L32 [Candidatus Neomarinimicrobiota bacterium]MDP6593710.1 50S ribosomal protein L32 [Candidatus Neomarinimicrobiota bacterium]MDP6836387.1 50S ribosomal protein L32 [Candidatus Neomarinimicrobiota bacterium]MDP6966048.1 50S ribosomal protein L32 [Candidatus Neomarinimicrobiota bacterium]